MDARAAVRDLEAGGEPIVAADVLRDVMEGTCSTLNVGGVLHEISAGKVGTDAFRLRLVPIGGGMR